MAQVNTLRNLFGYAYGLNSNVEAYFKSEAVAAIENGLLCPAIKIASSQVMWIIHADSSLEGKETVLNAGWYSVMPFFVDTSKIGTGEAQYVSRIIDSDGNEAHLTENNGIMTPINWNFTPYSVDKFKETSAFADIISALSSNSARNDKVDSIARNVGVSNVDIMLDVISEMTKDISLSSAILHACNLINTEDSLDLTRDIVESELEKLGAKSDARRYLKSLVPRSVKIVRSR